MGPAMTYVIIERIIGQKIVNSPFLLGIAGGQASQQGPPRHRIPVRKLRQYRSLATRYDKIIRSYSDMVAIACVLTSLRLRKHALVIVIF